MSICVLFLVIPLSILSVSIVHVSLQSDFLLQIVGHCLWIVFDSWHKLTINNILILINHVPKDHSFRFYCRYKSVKDF